MIISHIERIKDQLRGGEFTSEAAVSQGIILPTLHELGWPVFDTRIVTPEYSLKGRRVDYALCHPASRPSIFIEVKKVGFSDGADIQLFEYAFHSGVPMAILTDGQEWSFYLPGGQGRYDERRVYKLDLLERNVEEAAKRLERYIQYKKVCSGEALESARSDYQNVTRNREINTTIPKAWKALLEEPDSLLVELLAEKTADLCGYNPGVDVCSRFLTNEVISKNTVTPIQTTIYPTEQSKTKTEKIKPTSRTRGNFSFSFERKNYQERSARSVMVKVFKLLANSDPGFLERFASRKHGQKRRYIAQNKDELYPGRPDLAREYSVEIAPGWWMGVNYSRNNIQQILDLAGEVTKKHIEVNVL